MIVYFLKISLLLCIYCCFVYSSGGIPGYFLTKTDPRSAVLGSSYIGLSDDISTVFHNPAGLVYVNQNEFSSLYIPLYEGSNYWTLSSVFPTNSEKLRDLTIGLANVGLVSGEIERRNEYNQLIESSLRDINFAFIFGFGLNIKPQRKENVFDTKLSLGFSSTFIHKSFDNISSWGYGVNIGAIYQANSNLRTSLFLKNLLPPKLKRSIGYDTFPLELNIGVSYKPLNWLSLACGLRTIPTLGIYEVSIGVENKFLFIDYSAKKLTGFTLRAGLTTNREPAFGIGILIKDISFDYSFLSQNILGPLHVISFNYRWGTNKYLNYAETVSKNKYKIAKNLLGVNNFVKAKKELKEAIEIDIFNKEVKDLYKKVISISRDKIPPEIEMLSPKEEKVITNKNSLGITLLAKDNLMISSVTIAGNYIPISPDAKLDGIAECKSFVSLKDGENEIEIKAIDAKGNITTRILKAICDTKKPKISVIFPKGSTKDSPFVTTSEHVEVICEVRDEYGIQEVKIGEVTAKEKEPNKFSQEIYILPGNNSYTIKATDKAGNITEINIYIKRIEKEEKKLEKDTPLYDLFKEE